MRLSTILIPDTDGEFNDELRRVEEILLALANADHPDDPDPDPAWSPPPTIARGAASAGALGVALRDATTVRMLSGHGSYELVPLLQVVVDESEVAELGAAIEALGRGMLTGHDLITEMVGEWASHRRDRSGTDLVARAAQAHAILSLPGDADTALLLTRMPAAGDWNLTPEELAAYDRHVARVLAVWHTGDQGRTSGLDWWLYFGAR